MTDRLVVANLGHRARSRWPRGEPHQTGLGPAPLRHPRGSACGFWRRALSHEEHLADAGTSIGSPSWLADPKRG